MVSHPRRATPRVKATVKAMKTRSSMAASPVHLARAAVIKTANRAMRLSVLTAAGLSLPLPLPLFHVETQRADDEERDDRAEQNRPDGSGVRAGPLEPCDGREHRPGGDGDDAPADA